MGFLSAVLAKIVEWAVVGVGGYVIALIEKMKNRKDNQNSADASVKPLEDAKTAQEISDATDAALRKF